MTNVGDHALVDLFFDDSSITCPSERILHDKWTELKQFNTTKHLIKIAAIELKLWKPRDIYDPEKTLEDIDNLYPELLSATTNDLYSDDYYYLRHLIDGRTWQDMGYRFIIRDKMTDRYLGIADDMIMINHTLRYNLDGYDLVNCIAGLDNIEIVWKEWKETATEQYLSTSIGDLVTDTPYYKDLIQLQTWNEVKQSYPMGIL
jgi:hypothetical protein